MDKFMIQIDQAYYKQSDDGEIEVTEHKQQAAVIEGTINLNSHWQRIIKAMRYNVIKPSQITVRTL